MVEHMKQIPGVVIYNPYFYSKSLAYVKVQIVKWGRLDDD